MAKKVVDSKKSESGNSKLDELRKKMKKNAPSLKSIKKQNDEDDAVVGSRGSSEFLEFVDGKTVKFRFLPPHNDDMKNFFLLRKRYWLPFEKQDGEMSRTTVLDSIRHGGTQKDICDEFIKLAKKINKGDDKKLKKVTDSYGGGLAPEHMWLAYAISILGEKREFGILPFKKTVRDEINKINFVEEDDEPVEAVDTFTGEGYPLLVKYNSKPNRKKGEEYYTCNLGKNTVDLTDDEILKWGDAKPLDEIYLNCYTISDFERALEGLRLFDEENELGVFDDDRWDEIVEEVKTQYGEEDEDDEPKKSSKKKPAKPAPKKKVVEEEDDDDADDDADDYDDDDDDDEEDDDDALKRIKDKLKKSKK